MANRMLRTGFVVVPILSLTFGLIVACSDDDLDPPASRPDAAVVPPLRDGSNNDTVDANRPDTGNDDDSGSDDDAGDGGVEAEAPPPFCVTYPSGVDLADAAIGEISPTYRYAALAYRAVMAAGGANGNPTSTCEIAAHFDELGTLYDPPQQPACLEKQLLAIAGCELQGFPVDYSNIDDGEGSRCADGTSGIHLGFRDPQLTTYTHADVVKFIEIIAEQSRTVGFTQVDADRLKAALMAKIGTVALSDAGDDGGYSNSLCP